jgi:hypothetical protein
MARGNLHYKDSYGNGLAVLLALAGAVIDVFAVRCILAAAAATLLLWPPLHRRFGMTPAMTLMLVCGLGLFGGGVWRLIEWRSAALAPIEAISPAPPAEAPPATAPPHPHIRLQLAIESVGKVDIPFHLEAENIGDVTVTRITKSFRGADISEQETYPSLLPRTLPPKGKIVLPGTPVNWLVKSRWLSVALLYDCEVGGKTETLQSDYRFVLPPQVKAGQLIDPSEWTENMKPQKIEMDRSEIIRKLSAPSGGISFVAQERNPDGSVNNISMRGENKLLTVNFSEMTAEFSITFASGKTKKLLQHLKTSANQRHLITVTWDVSKDYVIFEAD